jgi:hypothetical protein
LKISPDRFDLIVVVDMSPSIGTPPRFIQTPSINDTRLVIPSLTQNINNKWDSIALTDGIFFVDFYSKNVFELRSTDW